jgi:hypothetical protein
MVIIPVSSSSRTAAKADTTMTSRKMFPIVLHMIVKNGKNEFGPNFNALQFECDLPLVCVHQSGCRRFEFGEIEEEPALPT